MKLSTDERKELQAFMNDADASGVSRPTVDLWLFVAERGASL
jgi:hypothetical protein